MGVSGVPWHPQILADQLTLSQLKGGRLCPPNDILLYEMPSNSKGKNFFSKVRCYCPQNTMEIYLQKVMPLENNNTLDYHKCHHFQRAKLIIIQGHFFIKIRVHQEIDFAGNTCKK